MTDEHVCELRVTDGPNRDAVVALGVGRHRIGSAIIGEIVLVDPTVAPEHAVITLPAHPVRGEVTVAADQARIMLDGGDSIEPGDERTLSLPVNLGIGQSSIHLVALRTVAEGQPPPTGPAQADGATRFAASISALLVLAVALIAFGLGGHSTPVQADLTTPISNLPVLRPGSAPVPVSAKVEALRTKIATMPDMASLSVDEEDGAVVLSGPIEPASVIKLAPLQRWFDAEWNGRAVLINRTAVQSVDPPPKLAIEAVWRGRPAPYIVVGGERYLEGAMVEGGWVIDRIGSENVVLRRQNRIISVRF